MSFEPTFLIRAFFETSLIGDLWWFWSFLVLLFLALSFWLAYVREHFIRAVSWTLLELRVPRELRKSPKAMEQIFTSIYNLRNSPGHIGEKWWEGEVTLWFSCEMASFGGEIRFYIRTPSKHRNIVESAVYANYPDLEVAEVSADYIERFPRTFDELEKSGYKIFGNELILAKPDPYPLRSYVDFEAIEEERQLDPISALLELLSKLKPQETIWLQVLCRPKVDDSWKEAGEKLVAKLKEKSKTEIATPTGKFTWTERSPGEVDIMKAVERNVSKPGFDVVIRYIYFAPAGVYDSNLGQRGMLMALNQYMSESLNKLSHNKMAWTRSEAWYWPHIFPEKRGRARKRKIYRKYREREMYAENFGGALLGAKFYHWGFGARKLSRVVLNTEELATIFHPPTYIVLTGPLIKRVEARKIGPPAGLPIYGEEETPLESGKK